MRQGTDDIIIVVMGRHLHVGLLYTSLLASCGRVALDVHGADANLARDAAAAGSDGYSGAEDREVPSLAGIFLPTGDMLVSRRGHTATLLPSGKVLIVGGYGDDVGDFLAEAELYDPRLGAFTATGSLRTARSDHTATLLPNGKVLIAGGTNYKSSTDPFELASVELYEPSSGVFSPGGAMITARQVHTATLLQSGKVLIAGGLGGRASAELYDAATGTFTATGGLADSRYQHTATLLQNGSVLITGGVQGSLVLQSAELYDPIAGKFAVAGSMADSRSAHAATLLGDGRVLVTGGDFAVFAELYDPPTGAFTRGDTMVVPREGHTATLLANGGVLIAGGDDFGQSTGGLAQGVAEAELYDVATETFTAAASMTEIRYAPSATLLPDGRVLIAGGSRADPANGSVSIRSAELFE